MGVEKRAERPRASDLRPQGADGAGAPRAELLEVPILVDETYAHAREALEIGRAIQRLIERAGPRSALLAFDPVVRRGRVVFWIVTSQIGDGGPGYQCTGKTPVDALRRCAAHLDGDRDDGE